MCRRMWLLIATVLFVLMPFGRSRAEDDPATAAQGKKTRSVKTYAMHKQAVLSLAFNPTDPHEWVSGQYDKYFTALRTPSRVLLWDPSRPRLIKFMDHGQFNGITAVDFSADGKYFAMSGANKHIEVWTHDVDVAKIVAGRILYGHLNHVPAVAFSPVGTQFASGSMDATIRIWDPAKVTGHLLKTLTGHKGPVNTVAWAGEKTLVSGGSDHTVRTWDVAAGKESHVLKGHTGCVNTVHATPDGKLALSVSNDGTLRIWDVSRGKLLQTLPAHDGPVEALAISADGKLALTGGVDTKVRLWSVGTYKD